MHIRSLTLSLMLATTFSVVAPEPVYAQSKREMATAKSRFNEGKKLFKKEQYAEAAAKFKEAYDLSQRPELLYNVGQSYKLAGENREAEKYLQQYLAEAADPPNADEVVQQIVELQQQIAMELATVQVETAVAGRAVYVDDETAPRCSTPCAVTVPPGDRRLRLSGDDVIELIETVTLEPGQTTRLDLRLKSANASGGLMVVTDRAGGTLSVAGQSANLPLSSPLQVNAGEHEVTVESGRKARWTGRVTIEDSKTTEVLVPMQAIVDARRRGSLRKSIAYGLVGVSAASTLGAILLGSQANKAFDQLEAQQARNGFVDGDLVGQGEKQQRAANIMFVVAGTSLLSGVGLFLWDELGGEKKPTAAAPASEELSRN